MKNKILVGQEDSMRTYLVLSGILSILAIIVLGAKNSFYKAVEIDNANVECPVSELFIKVNNPFHLEHPMEKPFKISSLVRGDTSLSLSLQLKIPNFFSLQPEDEWMFESSPFHVLNETLTFLVYSQPIFIYKGWITLKLVPESSVNENDVTVDRLGIKKKDGALYKLIERGKDKTLPNPLLLIKISDLFADKNAFGPSGDVTFFCDVSDGCGNEEDNAALYSRASWTEALDQIEFLETLSNDLGKFYDKKTDSDCVIKCGDVQYPVHRHVLSARSEVFAAMFHHDTSESRSGDVDITDIDASIFGYMLHYLYRGKIRGLSEDTATRMYVAADKYGLLELRGVCLKFLLSHLAVENISDAAVVAHTHGEVLLKKEIINFIDENLEEVIENDKWQKFFSKNPNLANKLLSASYLKRVKRDKLARV